MEHLCGCGRAANRTVKLINLFPLERNERQRLCENYMVQDYCCRFYTCCTEHLTETVQLIESIEAARDPEEKSIIVIERLNNYP